MLEPMPLPAVRHIQEQSAAEMHEGLTGKVTIATPVHPDRKAALPVQISIPAHQLAVIVKP